MEFRLQTERWRRALASVLIAIILVLALLLRLAGLVLQNTFPAFEHWVQHDGSTLDLLLIMATATGATFLGAALAGRKLTRFATGRTPMGTAKRSR
jgi:small-conductance mechanosensitive channel